MSTTTLIAPSQEGKEFPSNPKAHSQGMRPVRPTSELEGLNAEELKAAIQSAWKKHERLAQKEMGPLLYWLRAKLRAQGSRNDLHEEEKGFGAWVEDNCEITRRTADRWADQYARENGFVPIPPTSGHESKSLEGDFDGGRLGKYNKNIRFDYWVSKSVHGQYEQAVKTIKKHFEITKDKEAVVKGVCYAADIIANRSTNGKRNQRSRARNGRLRT